jgi:hypothetical protein
MPGEEKQGRGLASRLMEGVCERLPNCGKAMELVERGCERPLTMAERIGLKYHGRLCPFCACATGKFESAMARMKEAESKRQGRA